MKCSLVLASYPPEVDEIFNQISPQYNTIEIDAQASGCGRWLKLWICPCKVCSCPTLGTCRESAVALHEHDWRTSLHSSSDMPHTKTRQA